MLIVPEDDALVVEAKIAPQDIDQVHVGQAAFVRFTAFNQRTTPEFNGKVMRVAADLTKDPQTGQAYFVARIGLPDSGDEALGRDEARPRHAGRGLHPHDRTHGAVLSSSSR